MTVMRKKHRRAHGAEPPDLGARHSVFEVDFPRVARSRGEESRYERAGVKLTYMPFIVKAAVEPCANSRSSTPRSTATTIIYHKDVNVGIAVALEWGLIVPVIKHADDQNLLGLSRAIADLADARAPSS